MKTRKAEMPKNNKKFKATKIIGVGGWNSPWPTRVNHAPAFGDLSSPMRAAHNQKPTAADVVESGEER